MSAAAFEPSAANPRCLTCRYQRGRLAKWIHDRLKELYDAEEFRPQLKDIYRGVCDEFPKYAERVTNPNTLNNHLQTHEPLWKEVW